MKYYGMHHTQLDPFLFVGEKVIFICCVDDLISWSQNYSEIDNIAKILMGSGVYLEESVYATGFPWHHNGT